MIKIFTEEHLELIAFGWCYEHKANPGDYYVMRSQSSFVICRVADNIGVAVFNPARAWAYALQGYIVMKLGAEGRKFLDGVTYEQEFHIDAEKLAGRIISGEQDAKSLNIKWKFPDIFLSDKEILTHLIEASAIEERVPTFLLGAGHCYMLKNGNQWVSGNKYSYTRRVGEQNSTMLLFETDEKGFITKLSVKRFEKGEK